MSNENDGNHVYQVLHYVHIKEQHSPSTWRFHFTSKTIGIRLISLHAFNKSNNRVRSFLSVSNANGIWYETESMAFFFSLSTCEIKYLLTIELYILAITI